MPDNTFAASAYPPPGVDPNDWLNLQRQQMLTQALMQQAMAPIQQPETAPVKGLYVQPRVGAVQGLSKLVDALLAGRAMDRTAQQQAALQSQAVGPFWKGNQPIPRTGTPLQAAPADSGSNTDASDQGVQPIVQRAPGASLAQTVQASQPQFTPTNPMNPLGLPPQLAFRMYMQDPAKYGELIAGTPEWRTRLAAYGGDAQAAMAAAQAENAARGTIKGSPNETLIIPGVGPMTLAPPQLSPKEIADIQAGNAQRQLELARPVDTGAAARVPLATFAAQQGVATPQPVVPGSSPGGVQAAPGAAAALAAPTQPAPVLLPRRPPAQQQQQQQQQANNFSDAPPAPAWVTNPNVVVPAGQDPKLYAAADQKLRTEAAGIGSTQADIVKVQRALGALENAKVGPGTQAMSELQTTLGNITGNQFVSLFNNNPAARQLLTKLLGQDAIDERMAEAREDGAGQVRFGAQMMNQFQKISADPSSMNKDAVRGVLNWELQQHQYDAQRQQSINAYLAQGRDARAFESYYAQRNPLSAAVNTQRACRDDVARRRKWTAADESASQRGAISRAHDP